MENRVYYGEYTLKHWIDLILKKNIILPDYQRHFVWNKKQVQTLINSLKLKQFVPPITIGAYTDNDINQNLIIDGQQRLTSVFLAYLSLFPDTTNFKTNIKKFADENDGVDIEEEELIQPQSIIQWTFKRLLERGSTKQKILENLIDGNYKQVDFDIDDNFFKKTFLGFSYLVPDNQTEINQQKYYSSVFRNINIQGEALLPQESRASLYYLDKDLAKFFEPDFANEILIKNTSSESKIDFVRYLSLLSQYRIEEKPNDVAKRYGRKMEKYYEEYIYSVVGEIESQTFFDFNNVFPDKEFKSHYIKLTEAIESLDLNIEFNSIIDLDMYMFGLIYIIIFKKKSLDFSKKEEIKEKISRKIEILKGTENHKNSPRALKYLRARIHSSVLIYKRYISNE
ncbi:DUF262 domain-containing protein [Tenacibaculum ovolyticum]|uniref:DUF262 domain-containing protein n=1 Tax=Tenacibaculum ovolyticum TaxID=104270 RepID=UPI0007ECB3AE|nr:DUF262 domain-containing protein [Tenacibaculum ovolyticum]